MHPLAVAAGELLDEAVVSAASVSGGNLSEVVALQLNSGRTVVAKDGPAPILEARMLQAIADSGAPVPKVLAVNDQVLVMDRLPEDGSLNGPAWENLGVAARSLHGKSGQRYGWEADFAFGKLPICNKWREDWHRFWAENRLLAEAHALPRNLTVRLETLSIRLVDFIPQNPEPRLLHGDLWTGNVLTGKDGSVALIDPACYFGDPEVDLAMLCLFGTPPPVFWDIYGPRDSGWEQRCAVYQLWPAIVHLCLFGSGYTPLCNRLLKTLGC